MTEPILPAPNDCQGESIIEVGEEGKLLTRSFSCRRCKVGRIPSESVRIPNPVTEDQLSKLSRNSADQLGRICAGNRMRNAGSN